MTCAVLLCVLVPMCRGIRWVGTKPCTKERIHFLWSVLCIIILYVTERGTTKTHCVLVGRYLAWKGGGVLWVLATFVCLPKFAVWETPPSHQEIRSNITRASEKPWPDNFCSQAYQTSTHNINQPCVFKAAVVICNEDEPNLWQ